MSNDPTADELQEQGELAPEGPVSEHGEEDIARELFEARQQVLRAQADFENYRKRVRRERDEERQFANQPLIMDLLSVVDNLQRALDAGGQASSDGLSEGVRMVAAQIKDVLRQHNCEQIPALGQPFDPHLHEAVGQQPAGDKPPGTVLVEVQGGWKLHDRVIRPAHVIVAASDA